MPRTKLQNERIRLKSEEKILKVALVLFGRYGYERTSIRMIAREANISLGLMYNYFESKEVLLLTLVMQALGEAKGNLGSVESEKSPRENLSAFLHRYRDLIRNKRLIWKLFYHLRMNPDSVPLLGAEGKEMQEVFLQHLGNLFRANGKSAPEMEARILLGTLDGIFQHFISEPESYPLDAVLSKLEEKLAG